MNLYLLSQDENNDYDTYDSMVVAAESEEEARNIMPGAYNWDDRYNAWCSSPDKVKVRSIGVAVEGTKKGTILASFNAG